MAKAGECSEPPDVPIGSEFDRLTTIGLPVHRRRYKGCPAKWEVAVECSCPAKTQKMALVWQLLAGKAKSCGCLRAEKHTRISFIKGYRKEKE